MSEWSPEFVASLPIEMREDWEQEQVDAVSDDLQEAGLL